MAKKQPPDPNKVAAKESKDARKRATAGRISRGTPPNKAKRRK